jgi:hypothetical protein
MAFNASKFEQAQLVARTEKVSVPGLAAFFDEGEEPIWVVRGLTAGELYHAAEAKARQTDTSNLLSALSNSSDAVEAMRKVLGLTKDTPGEIVKRLEMLVLGSVVPKIELAVAVKLGEKFPVEFMQLTNEIVTLTGKGAEVASVGKPESGSKKTKPS